MTALNTYYPNSFSTAFPTRSDEAKASSDHSEMSMPVNLQTESLPGYSQDGFQRTVPQPATDLRTYQAMVDQLPHAQSMPPEIYYALILMGQIQHLPQDIGRMQELGVDFIFQNGAEALKVILEKGVRVEFGDMGDTKAHAQWLRDENLVMINQKYQGKLTKDSLYAISEAIYHEAGHAARLGDNRASIQEEVNCLALNTLAHRFHVASDPDYGQTTSSSRLITDGVALYSKLFYGPDVQPLVNRVVEKYGSLPPETPDHQIPAPWGRVTLADLVVRQVVENDFNERLAAIEADSQSQTQSPNHVDPYASTAFDPNDFLGALGQNPFQQA